MKTPIVKMVLIAHNDDPMKIKVALLNGLLPGQILSEDNSLESLFEYMTGIDSRWIPFSRKVSFFIKEDTVSCAYAVLLPEEISLKNGHWVEARSLLNETILPDDLEIFRTALGTI